MANINFDTNFRAPSGETSLSFELEPNNTGIDRIITITLEDDSNLGYEKVFTLTQKKSDNPEPFTPGSPATFVFNNIQLTANKMCYSGSTVRRFYVGSVGPFVLNLNEDGYVVGE